MSLQTPHVAELLPTILTPFPLAPVTLQMSVQRPRLDKPRPTKLTNVRPGTAMYSVHMARHLARLDELLAALRTHVRPDFAVDALVNGQMCHVLEAARAATATISAIFNHGGTTTADGDRNGTDKLYGIGVHLLMGGRYLVSD